MLQTMKQFFDRCLNPTPADEANTFPLEKRLQLATAALLIEMMHADFAIDAEEEQALVAALHKAYQLNDDELDEILRLAHQEKQTATELFSFTHLINQHYSDAQKKEVIRLLWQVASADNVIDKHEVHLIRKIADLLYVPREIAMGLRGGQEAE